MYKKEDILNEIKRTTKENGGVPVGRDRFQDETGIKEYDWQKFWPRFGDAQRDAGFTPNKLKTAYEDTYLFEKFIELMRELQKWPIKGDIRVKRNSQPDFPNDKTFFRLGTKYNFANKLLQYAESKDYADVVNICKKVIMDIEAKMEEKSSDSNLATSIGSVYLCKSGRFYKIGRTNSMGRRHHEITILLPEGLMLIHEIRTDDPSGVEVYWHKRFELKRKNGEWFDLNSTDVRAFKKWRKIV
jgi:hypothetical protein